MNASGRTPEIRNATVRDAEDIARLSGELGYANDTHTIAKRLARLGQDPNQFVAVALLDAAVVGWVAAERRLILVYGERGEITGLVVSSQHRRSGVGQRLVAAVETWLASSGLSSVLVRSNMVRPESHDFYEKIGYERSKTQHSYRKRIDTTGC